MMSTQTPAGQANTTRQSISKLPVEEANASSGMDATTSAELGHLQLAREIYEHILANQPDHLESLRELGQMCVEQGEYAVAIQRLTKALALDPADAQSQHRLGLAYAALGELSKAEQAHRRAVELDPGMTLAHYQLGIVLQKQNKLGEATGSFQQTLRLDQNHGGAFNQLGSAEQQGEIPISAGLLSSAAGERSDQRSLRNRHVANP